MAVCFNYSQDNITTNIWIIEDETRSLVIAIFLTVFMLVGVPWNIAAMTVIIKQHLFKQPTHLLFFSLALSNFLICITYMPFSIISGFAGEFIFGSNDYVRCQVCQMGYMLPILLLTSVYSVTMLSVDRLLYLKKPLKYDKIVTIKRTIAALIVSWVLCIVFTLLSLAGNRGVGFVGYLTGCLIQYVDSYIYLWICIAVLCVVPLITLVFTNTWMICIIQKNIRDRYHRSLRYADGERRPSLFARLRDENKKKQIRLTQIFAATFVINLLTWMPTVITFIMVATEKVDGGFIVFAHLCLFSQTVVHPILHTVFLKDIRVEMKRLCCCCFTDLACSKSDEVCQLCSKSDDVCKLMCEDSKQICGKIYLCGCALLDACGAATVTPDSVHTEESEVP